MAPETSYETGTRDQLQVTNHITNHINNTPLTPQGGKQDKKFTDDDFSFAERMLKSIRHVQPDFKQPNLESWASVICLMREEDNRDYHDMAEIWTFARGDPFWQTNILSAKSFRNKFDRLKAKKYSQGNHHGSPVNQQVNNSAPARVRAATAEKQAQRERARAEREVN